MHRRTAILILFTLFSRGYVCLSQDTVKTVTDTTYFSGQLSAWGNYNIKNALPLQFGGRYIPVMNGVVSFPEDKKLDLEVSADIYGFLAVHPFDSLSPEGSIVPYRAWMRFSARQWEVRVGLQKINFGSATLLRPLMWFDQLDPRDPLQVTSGVWGLLFRYYFLNNANMWIWGLFGNDKARPWDIGKTSVRFSELGGRFQTPVPKGEIALTYHFRMADTRKIGNTVTAYSDIPENRIGLDAKWDLGAGIWFEGAWINKSKKIGQFTNQEILNIGTDNTFKIGNGLTLIFEQLLVANDEHPFAFSNNILFSALSLSYPFGMSDNLSAIVYFDWKNKKSYNFITWNHKFKYLSTYLMAYWNPETYNLPQQGNNNNTYAGPGIQIMFVYYH